MVVSRFDFFGDVGAGRRFGIVETDQHFSSKSERSVQQRYRLERAYSMPPM